MAKQKLIFASLISLFLLSGCSIFPEEEISRESSDTEKVVESPVAEKEVVTPPVVEPAVRQVKVTKFADIYPENNEVLLSTLAVLSNLDDKIRRQVEKYIEDTEVYYVTQQDNGVFIVKAIDSDSEKFQRHGIELVEISTDGTIEARQLAKTGDEDDNDVWEFDEETKLPVKHVHYNTDEHIEYCEYWNYSGEEPVKYELKDSDDKTIAIKKEVQDGDSNIRIENLIYDEDGNTKLNITINYEGPYITRFTYFNAETPEDGVVIVGEFEDGVEVKETVYSTDYKVKNVYEASYKNGIRDSIKVFDNEHRELEEILSD